ncbi:hypothetical protein FAUST_7298 [Fusarium austroamericanum]|uniref:Uncharacterized protein n=1 Tax=Fusarium austroamericanum TaxID=282268 RepID=A0AAN5Z8X4_FUSAU|nr:hypothetical protein FAUST_7298 [Fusarium austroamericanum]
MFSELYLTWRRFPAVRFLVHLGGLLESLSKMFPDAPGAIYRWATLENLNWLKELGILIFEKIQEVYEESTRHLANSDRAVNHRAIAARGAINPSLVSAGLPGLPDIELSLTEPPQTSADLNLTKSELSTAKQDR